MSRECLKEEYYDEKVSKTMEYPHFDYVKKSLVSAGLKARIAFVETLVPNANSLRLSSLQLKNQRCASKTQLPNHLHMIERCFFDENPTRKRRKRRPHEDEQLVEHGLDQSARKRQGVSTSE
ncbi:hypothetical protein KIN20_003707 [Parelaphostrongylus tenuis]|uniref:Uncharacterized protein n=1 Tax=Parelaphostrongylus tenuis TaxID=148309 RepID=A0AAD5MG54_PARTN|nr:hypothetical protein KIN20_003707 [Parelaphostrongylus tenuis]